MSHITHSQLDRPTDSKAYSICNLRSLFFLGAWIQNCTADGCDSESRFDLSIAKSTSRIPSPQLRSRTMKDVLHKAIHDPRNVIRHHQKPTMSRYHGITTLLPWAACHTLLHFKHYTYVLLAEDAMRRYMLPRRKRAFKSQHRLRLPEYVVDCLRFPGVKDVGIQSFGRSSVGY